MSPAVRDGEYVIVAPLAPGEVALGDVVYCRARPGPLAHRVVAIGDGHDGERRFTLSGDAAPDHDRPVTAGDLRGKVVGVEREGELVSLAVAGGLLGRATLVAALELRRSLRAFGKRVIAAALTPVGAR